MGMPPPNYVNPPKRPPAVQCIAGIFIFITASVVMLRLYARHRVMARLGLDDALAIIAAVS